MAHLARIVRGGGIPDVVADARRDTAERIAAAIEADRDAVSLRIEIEQMCSPMDHEAIDAWASERVGLNRAARIAREIGGAS